MRIRAAAERERTEILANAERDALRIRGEGDAQATQIYARAYKRNPEFYAFYRSLQAYERSLGKEGDVLVDHRPDGEFFKYLKSSAPQDVAAPTPFHRVIAPAHARGSSWANSSSSSAPSGAMRAKARSSTC